jgi:ABC-type molybdate transport system substrate-binding protein
VHALHFARYVASKNKGLRTFAKHDFRTVEIADEMPENPKEKPTLRLYSGSMLRPAIEETVAEFAKREGVQIDTKYNGCGILLGEMKTFKEKGQDGYPDIFFACEPRFLKEVQENFDVGDTVSSNALVIAWRKDRDLDITKLADLGEEGLRLGVGHENQCALGVLTKEAFQFAPPRLKKVYENITMRAAAGDQLVLSLRAVKGPATLDVVVCYESNVKPFAHELHYQPLNTILKDMPPECAYPDQPVAIGKHTKYPRLARRLLDALQTPESRKRFEELGFRWKLDQGDRPNP